MPLVISDGYTRESIIPAENGRPAVKIKFRPALPEAVYEYGAVPKRGEALFKAMVGVIEKHLVSWDVTLGSNGDMCPIKYDYLRKIPHQVLEAILDAIFGYSASEEAADLKN